jgi:NAD(P)-dependent dehydrogenase (short-subunit alcohol dehydrogenase family)
LHLSAESVLITGASQGVGRGMALAAAAAGAAVTVTARKLEAAEPVVQEICARGGRAIAVVCDVTDRKQVMAAVTSAVNAFDGLSAVIHNAVSPQSSVPVPIEKVEDPYWNDQVAIALRGSFYCAQAALPHLRQSKGSFILLTSNGGIEGAVTLPVYAATKGAQRGFVKSLAREWGPLGVRVNAVAPVALTPAMENYFKLQPAMKPIISGRGALGRLGDCETDIGRAVNFLIGRDSGFVTGQTLVLTGGAYML